MSDDIPNLELEGGETPDWHSELPETIRENFKEYKSVGDLANAFLVGKNTPQEFKAPENEEELTKIYKALGTPESIEGYKFGLPEGVKADWLTENISDEWENGFKSEALKLGLTDKQASAIRNRFISDAYSATQKQQEASVKFVQAELANLKKDWGNDYENNVRAAEILVDVADPSGSFLKFLKETKLITHPQMVRFLGNIGIQTIEDSNLTSGNPDKGGAEGKTLADLLYTKNDN